MPMPMPLPMPMRNLSSSKRKRSDHRRLHRSGRGARRWPGGHDLAIRQSQCERTLEPELDGPVVVVNLVVMVRADWQQIGQIRSPAVPPPCDVVQLTAVIA
jgi:hypothetical protein